MEETTQETDEEFFDAQEDTNVTEDSRVNSEVLVEALAVLNADLPEDDPEELSRSLRKAEKKEDFDAKIAAAVASEDYSFQTLTDILDAAPFSNTTPGRQKVNGESTGTRVVFGMYTHGGMHGLCNKTYEYGNFVSYMNNFLKVNLPEESEGKAKWTSFSVNRNLPTNLHRDEHNHPGMTAYALGCGTYSGGGLWVEKAADEDDGDQEWTTKELTNGNYVVGKALDTKNRVVEFFPKRWHTVEDWTGDRWSVVAYTTRGAADATDREKKALRSRGFPFPDLRHLRRCRKEANGGSGVAPGKLPTRKARARPCGRTWLSWGPSSLCPCRWPLLPSPTSRASPATRPR